MEKLVTSAVVFAFCISLVYCQWPEERGIITSVYWISTYDKVRHLGKFPGYETINTSNIGAITEGLRFSNRRRYLLSVDVDFATKAAYVYDDYYRSVYVLSGYNKELDTTNLGYRSIHLGISEGSVQLAVDWLSHNLYFCDSVFRWIVAKPISDDKIDKDHYKIIVNDLLDSPGGIAVDPMGEYLFWADMGRFEKNAKIERSGLLGQDRMTIHIPDVMPPSNMDVDPASRRVYWIQRKSESLLWTSYDGQVIRHVTRYHGSILYDIAIFRDIVYMSDERYKVIFTVDKNTGQEMEKPISFGWYTIYGLAVYSEENQPLRDRDYCAEKNCDQLCFSNQTGATCDCSEGYIYNGTTETCQELNGGIHRTIVFASRTHICLYDIRAFSKFYFSTMCKFTVPKQNTTDPDTGDPTDPAVPPEDKIKMFDLNMNEVTVYYASMSNKIYARSLIQPIENEGTDFIARADGNISGLAYDAEDGNLYWSEIDTGTINMVNVKTKGRILNLNDATIEAPRNLLVLQDQRKLAWVSGQTSEMAIQTMDMDGTDMFDVINGFYEIGATTVDQERQIFYFLEPSETMVYSIPVDGSETPTPIYSAVPESAYLLLHYNNYLSWVYMYEGYGHVVGRYNYVDDVHFGNNFFDTETFIADIKVLDVKLQTPSRTSPCAFKNGGCDHFCITKHVNNQMAKICECRLGYRLQDDEKSCKTEVAEDKFIVAADLTNKQAVQCDLETNSINTVPIMQVDKQVAAVFFDAEKQKIIWSEAYDGRVYSANLNGTDKNILSDLGSTYAKRFTMDTVNGNIYYLGSSPPHIGMITPSGYAVRLNDDYLSGNLGAIAVHPEKGWLYFAVIDDPAYIARSNMDGTDTETIITGDHVQYPYGLTIDYENGHLYWSDYRLDIIQRCNLDGENCMNFVNITDGREQITDIVMDGDYLYYAAFKKSHIVRVNLTEPYERTEVGYNVHLGKLDNIALYRSDNKNTQPVGGECVSNGGLGDCSTFCLPTSTGRTCACRYGIALEDDNRTCSDEIFCPNAIENGTLDANCTRKVGGICDFVCDTGFTKTEENTFCSTDGTWHKNVNAYCTPHMCTDTISQPSTTCISEKIEITFASTCSRQLNERCNYVCPTSYRPTEADNTALKCTETGWERATAQLCAIYQCTDTIKTATTPSSYGEIDIKLSSTCTRHNQTTCDYECPRNFVPTNKSDVTLTCTEAGWDRESNLCEELLCPNSLENGTLDANCTRKVGEICDFVCDTGFTKTEENTFCTTNGTWHKNVNAYCTLYQCTATIKNATTPSSYGEIDIKLSSTCTRRNQTTCDYECPRNFVPTNKSDVTLTCTETGWDRESNLCEELLCQNSIENGILDANCTRKVGGICDFVCDTGFTKTEENTFCTTNGTWHKNVNAYCTPYMCTDTFSQPTTPSISEKIEITFASTCSRQVNESCNYVCPTSYTPTEADNIGLKCTAIGWERATAQFCSIYQCTATIKNATTPSSYGEIDIKLSNTCTRLNQTTCDYECPRNFVPTNKSDVTLTCTGTGWDRESNLCEELLCPNLIENGTLDANCTRKVGGICDFVCDTGFTKTEENTFCTTNGTWHKNVNAYCTPYMCTDTFSQPTTTSVSEKIEITFASTCSRQVNESCNYVCPTSYTPTETDNTALKCTATGWERATAQLCSKSVVVTPAPQVKDTVPKNNVIIITVVGALVIAILAAALAVLICRNMRNKPRFSKHQGTASYHKRPKSRDNISRTTSVNESYIHPKLSDISGRSATLERKGVVNPMYAEEPLPGLSHFDLAQDKTAMWYDRWMRVKRWDY